MTTNDDPVDPIVPADDPLALLRAIGTLAVEGEDEAFERAMQLTFADDSAGDRNATDATIARSGSGAPSTEQLPVVEIGAARERRRRWHASPVWLIGVAATMVALMVWLLPRERVTDIGDRPTTSQPPAPSSTSASPTTDTTTAPSTETSATPEVPAPTPSSIMTTTSSTPPSSSPTVTTSTSPAPGDGACTIHALQSAIDRDATLEAAGNKIVSEPHPLQCTDGYALATMWNPLSQYDDSANVFRLQADGWHRISDVMPECYWNLVRVGVPNKTAAKLIPPKPAGTSDACAQDVDVPLR